MADEISTLMANNKDTIVLIKLRNGRILEGSLQDSDVYMNLTLDDAKDITDEKPVPIGNLLLRGDNILAISIPPKE